MSPTPVATPGLLSARFCPPSVTCLSHSQARRTGREAIVGSSPFYPLATSLQSGAIPAFGYERSQRFVRVVGVRLHADF
ncbi:hypothetical protein EDF56_1039 [Novosphingobium sp. PhB165]|nr:hypothetical protein EDF56_1039 [Novosphingobium sp. PhB165]